MSGRALQRRLFETLVAEPEGRGGLSDRAAAAEPGAFLCNTGALALTKLADGLLSPKLVMAWLLAHLGAGSLWVGLLVPIRESLALLPQLALAPRLGALARRKWAWALGSAAQGLACLGMVGVALTLTGGAAGLAICGLLAFLALARAVCSITIKDLLGKTVGRSRRGAAGGLSASVASLGTVTFAVLLVVGGEQRLGLVLGALVLAALLWLSAGALYLALDEEADPPRPPRGSGATLNLLRRDPQLRLFLWTRGLLTATALAPPYLLVLGPSDGAVARLGALMLASAVAAFLSSYVWGRWADRSSRRVLQVSGGLGAVALLGAVAVARLGLAGSWWALPGVLFVLMIAYHGVRQGRATYLVDMAPPDRRADYTGLSNTIIGVVLLGSGAFGALASLAGADVTLLLFAAMSAAAVLVAARLDEVEMSADKAP